VKRDGAGGLVAMNQSGDQQMGTELPGRKAVHERRAGVALPPLGDIGWLELDRIVDNRLGLGTAR
jgi:hypothetical protein